ncbi:MAG: large conductance mechanosensitive channel protein MscL [Clostridia bacterium]|nr:large conductance mechanosensitive channel protein MscL [Clostridia bacterium]
MKKITSSAKSFFTDFKAFIAKGNILDMAVGVIIGGAFSPIVSSLVNDIIMPPLGLLIGDTDFKDLVAVLKPEVLDEAGEVVKKAVTINYGNFISVVLNFLLIALVIFTFLRIIVKSKEKAAAIAAKKKEQEAAEAEAAVETPAEPEVPAEPVETQEDILKDIRDCLKALGNKQ